MLSIILTRRSGFASGALGKSSMKQILGGDIAVIAVTGNLKLFALLYLEERGHRQLDWRRRHCFSGSYWAYLVNFA